MMKMKKIGSNQTVLEISVGPAEARQRDMYPFERISILFSYETPVAALVPDSATSLIGRRGWLRTDRKYSKTTTKHINSWLGNKLYVKTVPQSDIDTLLHHTGYNRKSSI